MHDTKGLQSFDDDAPRCATCHGTGRRTIPYREWLTDDEMILGNITVRCQHCKGTGRKQ